MKWRVVKLDEIKSPEKGALVSGPFGSNIGSRFFVATGVPVIRGNNLSMGQKRFIDDGFVFITEDKARELRNCNARSDDIIFTAAGTLGQVGLMPKIGRFDSYIISNKQIRLRLDTNQAFPLFAYYFLSSPDMRAFIASQNKGSSVPLLTLGIIRNLKIPLPPITTQKRIVAILSAYDELIENNQRRIALLEKMAEEIYREWFVRLRFPGHEKVKMVKGVPEGWEVRTLASIASEIKRGIKKKNLADAERYLGLEHIPRRSISIKEWATASTVESDKLLFQDRDILFGKIRPYLHKVALAHFSGACSSDTIVLRPKEKFYEGYLLFTIFSDTFIELATIASKGTKMPRADWGFLKQLELAIPDAKLLKVFQTKFELLFSQIVNLLRANEVLTASRDLLLPRLISGKLSVEHLDIQFPPGMEESVHDI